VFDRERLDAMVDEGWLRSQRHPEADLWIYNYTEKAQFENHWTPETLACRGLILDAEGGVVARPFPKFFNYGDPLVGELPMEPYTVREKVDGSLGILYMLDSQPRLATRGSFTSDQAIEGTRMLDGYQLACPPHVTPLFEIVYPENRIVVDYSGRRELVFLAALNKRSGREITNVVAWTGPVAETHLEPSLVALIDRDRPNCEGYVVTFKSGLRVKVKHAKYVRLHRIITGVNSRHIWEALAAGQDPTTELDGVPDEIYGWIESMVERLCGAYGAQLTEARRIFDGRPFDADRKTLAAYFKASGGNTGVLFKMLDGKPYDDLIWKAIKPEPTTPDTVWTRDTGAVV
jgi:RNA ligase